MHGGGERHLQDFGWEAEGKRPLGRPRHRWQDNIKMDLREILMGQTGFGWLKIVQWRAFVNTVMNLRVL
jgi:hypothetical protein